MQIIPDVYLVNGIPYWQHQNSYVVRLGDELVMIDSGDIGTPILDLVETNCARWGFHLSQISYLLVTHAHFDHSSHAAQLQHLGVKIVANRDCADAMAAGDERCVGYAVNMTFEPCVVDRVVDDGDELVIAGHIVRCIAAPGHANSCIVYEVDLHGQRLWFVGDVILTGQNLQTAQLGWNGGPDYDRAKYVASLRRLAHMSCDCLFPGHGPACIGNAKRIVEAAYTKAMMELR